MTMISVGMPLSDLKLLRALAGPQTGTAPHLRWETEHLCQMLDTAQAPVCNGTEITPHFLLNTKLINLSFFPLPKKLFV